MGLMLLRRGCPNCGGPITDDRLSRGLPCYRCLGEYGYARSLRDVCTHLKDPKGLSRYCESERGIERYEGMFLKTVGKPWSLQRTWMKRVLQGKSFAVVAPTGVGKTTFGLITSLFTGGKALLIFPTRLLSDQAYGRLEEMEGNLKTGKRILLYESKKRIKERFLNGDWDILVGTNMFFHKNFGNLMVFSEDLSFVFLDDIDSFLKRAKNVDLLFKLLGFTDRDIRIALKSEKDERDYGYLERLRERVRRTVLVVSSATLKPRTNRVKLFQNLLGFSVQKATSTVRNVEDTYVRVRDYDEGVKVAEGILSSLGGGGLLYLPSYMGREDVLKVAQLLREKGFNVITYLDGKPHEVYERMRGGGFDVAVGLANVHNPFVRGLDLPHVIRYAVFLDVPKYLFSVEISARPSTLSSLLLALMDVFSEEERVEARRMLAFLRRHLNLREESLDRFPKVKGEVMRIRDWLRARLEDGEFLRKIEGSPDVGLVRGEDGMYVVVADVSTYLQASGRTSRLMAGGMTKGLSVLTVWDEKAFRSLQKRLRLYFTGGEVLFKPLEDVNLEDIMKEIDRDRERAKAVLSGKIPSESKDLFKTTLVVVESPNKARTISSFFGKPQTRILGSSLVYEIPLGERVLSISASLGHVLDLSTEGGFFGVLEERGEYVGIYDTIKRCRSSGEQHTEYAYLKRRCPENLIEDKIEVIRNLQDLGYEVDEVIVATDPDAEGEKIAYDLYVHLRPFNTNVKRAEFHEITPRAFNESLKKLRDTDVNSVKAQMTRRIADRWVGFTLSRKLWEVFGDDHLSAGRVQTPVLGWVIERTRESRKKAYLVRVNVGNIVLERVYADRKEAERDYGILKNLGPEDVEVKVLGEEDIAPLPPYTTDTVLEDADRYLNLAAAESMDILQELFEKGITTYHRTDSTRVSDFGRFSVAKPFISERFGEEYFSPRSWGEGGAHECIRPTRPITVETFKSMVAAGLLSFSHPKALDLYALIFRRFMASQMRRVVVLKGEITLNGLSGEVVLDVLRDGFDLMWKTFKVFNGKKEIGGVEMRRIPKAFPFTEGSLIQEMKRRGLGRPSTYAKTVETLLKRGYVVKSRKGYLYSTRLGEKVYSFLMKRYSQYLSEEFTRRIEKAMDGIERGEIDWRDVLREIHRIKGVLRGE